MAETTNKYKLEDRTLQFSVRIIQHCMRIKQSQLQPITNQLIRSATSIGANYAEANNASSKTDFRAKIFIAKKEAAENKILVKNSCGTR
jgi:four helix bundle protein